MLQEGRVGVEPTLFRCMPRTLRAWLPAAHSPPPLPGLRGRMPPLYQLSYLPKYAGRIGGATGIFASAIAPHRCTSSTCDPFNGSIVVTFL